MTASDTAQDAAQTFRAHGPLAGAGPMRYSIATLVNDLDQYEAMLTSLRSGGFGGGDCEYLYIDNTTINQACAYSGLNALLNEARGRYVMLCHQDIRLLTDTRSDLDARLEELESLIPHGRWLEMPAAWHLANSPSASQIRTAPISTPAIFPPASQAWTRTSSS